MPSSWLRRRFGERWVYAADAGIALALALVGVLALHFASPSLQGRSPDALAYALALALTLPLALRSRTPLVVLGVVTLATLVYGARGYPSVNVDFFGLVLAFYTVASQKDRRTSVPAGIALWALVVVSILISPLDSENGASGLTSAVIIFAVWLFGDSVRQRRAYEAQLEAKTRELEAAQSELAAQAVVQERLRIARDLHDVVAHHISTIVVQAAVARDAVGVNQQAATDAIEHVQSISRGALGEIRQLLGMLRQQDNARNALSPSPGLADLDELVTRAREGGIEVESAIEGERTPVPPAVDVAAYRIVQEALTNVTKHANGSCARVLLRYAPDTLRIEVTNEITANGSMPRDATLTRGGMGIVGMRERAALLGGSLEAGPDTAGSFRVAALIPLDNTQ